MGITVVLGASDDPGKYSHKAVLRLLNAGETVFPVGINEGSINGLQIRTDKPLLRDVDTITIYVSPKHQPFWESYIFALHPKRIIFNPGAENPDLREKAVKQGIEVLEACTLVMLSVGNY